MLSLIELYYCCLIEKQFNKSKYTKYDIECCMAFYVTVVTFIVTLSMNKFTITVIPTYFQFIQTPIIDTNSSIIFIVANLR